MIEKPNTCSLVEVKKKLFSCLHSALLQGTKRVEALSPLMPQQPAHLHQCSRPLIRGVTACHLGL